MYFVTPQKIPYWLKLRLHSFNSTAPNNIMSGTPQISIMYSQQMENEDEV